MLSAFFFFNDTATSEIYTLSLHDALPIYDACTPLSLPRTPLSLRATSVRNCDAGSPNADARSEEHTSELQSQSNLVCRLLLEKKKQKSSTALCPKTHSLVPPPRWSSRSAC